MLDLIVFAAISLFAAIAAIGHVLVFMALAFSADGLPARRMEGQTARPLEAKPAR